MKKKEFDCVDLLHLGAQALREKLKGMTPQEVEAYWKGRNRDFLRLFKANRGKAVRKAPALRQASRQPV
jgi:hypothetical protein